MGLEKQLGRKTGVLTLSLPIFLSLMAASTQAASFDIRSERDWTDQGLHFFTGNDEKVPTVSGHQRFVSHGCLVPVRVGDCAAYTERYYFDSQEGKCKSFIFSGCGGNTNNFVSIDDCRFKCETVAAPPVPTSGNQQFSQAQCFLPPPDDPTSCSDPNQTPTIRWYYDNHDGVCYQFRYYCSNTSLNSFDTRQDCEDKCGTSQDFCHLPVVLGPCSGRFQQYYYDRDSDTCQSFEYSGCAGNANRFDTVVDCEKRCKNYGGDVKDGVQVAVGTRHTAEEQQTFVMLVISAAIIAII